MKHKFYHKIDPITDGIIDATLYKSDKHLYKYVREKHDDFAFFAVWRKAWPGINPKLSDLKQYRKWLKTDENYMANVGFPSEWHRKALAGERFG